MKVYKLKVKGVEVSSKWYCGVTVSGRRYRLPLFESKKASQDFAAMLEVMVGQHEAGVSFDKRGEMWLRQISTSFIKKFCKWGLLDAVRDAEQSELTAHLDDWRDALVAGGTGEGQAVRVHQRAGRIFGDCGFKALGDIRSDKVTAVIGKLQKTKTGNGGRVDDGPASSYTKLHFTRACKQFTKWGFMNGRLSRDPLAHLTIKNVRCENPRRALSVDEIACLLDYVNTAPAIWNIPGHERALIYELAVNTGLRRDEIKSLTRNSFDFERLSVRVDAKDTKNKKAALLPVKAALMDRIKQHLSAKLPTAPAFNIPQAAAILIKKDMQAARQQWIDAVKDNPKEHRRRSDSDFLEVITHEGKADFHSLRHSFGTLLAESGVHPKVAMDLMRHSDINLTLALYTHSNDQQQTDAIDALPSFGVETKRKAKKA